MLIGTEEHSLPRNEEVRSGAQRPGCPAQRPSRRQGVVCKKTSAEGPSAAEGNCACLEEPRPGASAWRQEAPGPPRPGKVLLERERALPRSLDRRRTFLLRFYRTSCSIGANDAVQKEVGFGPWSVTVSVTLCETC